MMSLVVVVKSEPTSALTGLHLQNLSLDYYRLKFMILGGWLNLYLGISFCVFISEGRFETNNFLSSLNLQLLLVE